MRVKTFALAALVLGLASCQREPEGLDVNLGTEVDTSITVAIPGNNTRAGGADSAEGIFANGLLTDTGSDLTMRYILQVYYMGEPSEERQVVYSDDSSVTFDIRLIPNRDYTFVVWADVVTEQGKVNGQYSSADDLHYNTSDLAAITLNNTWAAMDETRDAFTATKEVAGYNGQTSLNIELTRPFGKLRVKTTDLKELTDIGVTPQYATVSYTTPYRPGFNAVEGKAFAAGTSKKEHTIFAIAPYTNEANDEHNLTLFTDYLFAEEGDAVSFTLDVYEDEQMQKLIKSNNFNTDIAINRNHLTTIFGNILTDGNNITVVVKNDGAFDNSDNIEIVEVSNATNLQEAVNTSTENTTIVLGGDINLIAATTFSTRATSPAIIVPEDITTVIDLNGFSLTADENTYAINNLGTLTIKDSKGNGSINARGIYNGYGNGSNNIATATITIESGNINALGTDGGAAIYNYGVANINGGSFTSNGGYGLNNQAGGVMSISGGAIRGGVYNLGSLNIDGEDTSIFQHLSGKHAIYNYAATTTIDNGLFDSESGNELIMADGENSVVIINGGTFDKTAKSWLFAAATNKNIVFNIYGGTFRGYVNLPEMTVDTFRPYGDPILVYGGSFNFDPTNFLAEGYKAINTNGTWSVELNKVTDGVAQGDNNTYLVYNVNGLMWVAEQINSGEAVTSVKLSADIDLANTPWTPLGTADTPFSGTFNGNGHKISNLTIANYDYAAFIAYAAAGATVQDLTLENVEISAAKYAAGVVCTGDTGVTLEDIAISGTISATNYAGGICHNMDSVTILRCVNNATVSAQRAAGIASWAATNANIQDVENNGDITGSIGASGIAHGFAGTMNGAVNHGTITATGSEPAAGIAGVQKGASTYSYCTNYGDITSTADNPNSSAAGILGHTPGSKATFTYCANFGDITAEQSYAAGIAYSLYGQIDANYCYNKGAIFGADAAGAIAPKAQYGTADKASYCLNDGAITSSGTTYQAANNSTSCYYYNNGELLNVGNNAVVSTDDALASLNGGSDANFFEVENGVITVM